MFTYGREVTIRATPRRLERLISSGFFDFSLHSNVEASGVTVTKWECKKTSIFDPLRAAAITDMPELAIATRLACGLAASAKQ